jgi:WD40 repeat protein
MPSDSQLVQALQDEVKRLREQLAGEIAQKELLRAVLKITCEDNSVKNEQFASLFSNLSMNPVWAECQKESEPAVVIERAESEPEQPLSEQVPRPGITKALARPYSEVKCLNSCSDPWSNLPRELFVWFYLFLDHTDLCRAASVCKSWRDIANDNYTWSLLFPAQWQLDLHNKSSAWKNQLGRRRCTSSEAKTEAKGWKAEFRDRTNTRRNWVDGRPNIITMTGHTGTVTSLRYDETRLISGSDDGTLMLWDLKGDSHQGAFPLMQQHHKNTKMTRRLGSFVGHGGPVWCLDFSGNQLVSGSYDKTIKVWSIRDSSVLATLRGHTSWVSSIQLEGNQIVSGSWDSTLKLWQLPDEMSPIRETKSRSVWEAFGDAFRPDEKRPEAKCVTTLQGGPGNVVYCHQWDVPSGVVVTGTRSAAAQVWDLSSEQMVQTFMGHTGRVYTLQFDDHKLATGSNDKTVKIWDRKTGRCEQNLNGHTNPVMTLRFADHQMITGSYDKTMKVWDMRTGRVLNTLVGHSSAVFTLQFDYDKIVSGSADLSVKLWDFNKQYY